MFQINCLSFFILSKQNSYQKSRRFFIISIVLFCLCLSTKSYSNPITKCDSLIAAGVEAMQHNQHSKSLELLAQAKALSEKNHGYKQQFLAVNNIGANYYAMLEYGEALNYYLQAYKIALNKLEPKFEMIVLNNIAILYSEELKFDKANEYFSKAYTIAKENNDQVKVGLYAMNLGNVAIEMKKPIIARRYFEESIPLIKEQPNLILYSKLGLSQCSLLEGNPKSARKAAEDLIKVSKSYATDFHFTLLMIIANSYLQENNIELARLFANKILAEKPSPENKIEVFNLLSDINFRQKLYAEAVSYKDSVLLAKEQLNEIKNGKLYENRKVNFEIENYRNQIAANELKSRQERIAFYSIITLIAVIVIFIVWIFRNSTIRHKQNKLMAERTQKILELELVNKENANRLLEKQSREIETKALLEQEKLKNEIENKNRKLSAKALYLSGKNQLIETIINDFVKVAKPSKNDTIMSHINALKEQLKSDDEWGNFITHFEEVNQNFLTNLKSRHALLTANDIRFICYVFMNLSTKEIAKLLNVTVESCRKRKERIAVKMNLPPDVKFYDYLTTLK